MPLDQEVREVAEAFRRRLEASLADDPRFGAAERHDREDASALRMRFAVGEHMWIEACVRPRIPQFRAGIVTDDRWTSEDLEQAIEDSGDTMAEFVELGFDEAGLDWPEPIVEHYREDGTHFYFSTGLELDAIEALERDDVLEKARRMLLGYYEAFREPIEKASAEDER